MTTLFDRIKTSFQFAVADLDDLVPELHRLRGQAEAEKDVLKALEQEIEAAYGDKLFWAKARVQAAEDERNAVDAQVRAIALAHYHDDGGKNPHPKVSIKSYISLRYEVEAAINYAREHLPQALKLDKRAFEKAAKVLELDFVERRGEPKVFVAKDLSDAGE